MTIKREQLDHAKTLLAELRKLEPIQFPGDTHKYQGIHGKKRAELLDVFLPLFFKIKKFEEIRKWEDVVWLKSSHRERRQNTFDLELDQDVHDFIYEVNTFFTFMGDWPKASLAKLSSMIEKLKENN